ncbi:hypothetical protein PSTU1396_07065 [Providencia stuartii]|uniref:Uncharacterized protein n=1 Tax=Providencia stuartii ATCC 25827 TaxID=471874 RepID=A0AA86YU67_PROST|nr:hypothetical protein DR96_15 [Providencia stuartii]EDU60281.1 hypothetical protein PROSTU_03487 [Providencia stuartii ATCC 25827]SST03219.1 Uncharacterised protein [Acinetobacter baumannii]CAK6609074.1 hypothetical protein PSTU1396_07065 [Providencia stuartii]CAK6611063.1 hypothetical protein PS9952019_07055 [Providencia stuartii]
MKLSIEDKDTGFKNRFNQPSDKKQYELIIPFSWISFSKKFD